MRFLANENVPVVDWYWHRIPCHFAHVRLDAWVVMPNHVHGILWIVDNDHVGAMHPPTEVPTSKSFASDEPSPIPDGHAGDASPLHPRPTGAPSGSLGAVVGNFKSAVTRPMKRKWAGCSSEGRLTFDTEPLHQPAAGSSCTAGAPWQSAPLAEIAIMPSLGASCRGEASPKGASAGAPVRLGKMACLAATTLGDASPLRHGSMHTCPGEHEACSLVLS